MSNDKFQRALKGEVSSVPPVWFMRQAGRYHNHYQEMKKEYKFEELCKQPDLAAETAMGPIRDFDFDVSILFSDLLFPLEALGVGLRYDPGPILSHTLDEKNIKELIPVDQAISFMEFQAGALKKTREALPETKSLIGFVGGPWTLFTYAVEGSHKGHLLRSKNNNKLWHEFAEIMTDFLERNIRLQLDSGAEIVMIFDTAAGEVSSSFFEKEVSSYLSRLSRKFPMKLGYYSKGTVMDHLVGPNIRCDSWAGWGVDHRFNLPELLRKGSFPGFLQGNFDQALLFGEESVFIANLNSYLDEFRGLTPGQRARWVCGLGHGVLPSTPEKNVRHFVKRVREVFGNE